MDKPDAMSRKHNLNGGENDNIDVTVLSSWMFRELAIRVNYREVDVIGADMHWYDQIKEKMQAQIELEVQKAITQKQQGVWILEDSCIT